MKTDHIQYKPTVISVRSRKRVKDQPEVGKSKISSAVMDERTFIMIKPDGVNRGLVADIIKRFEQKGFKLVAMKFMKVVFSHSVIKFQANIQINLTSLPAEIFYFINCKHERKYFSGKCVVELKAFNGLVLNCCCIDGNTYMHSIRSSV